MHDVDLLVRLDSAGREFAPGHQRHHQGSQDMAKSAVYNQAWGFLVTG
jgi:hypothetical protein